MEVQTFFIYLLSYIGLFTMSFYFMSLWKHYKKPEPKENDDKTVTIIIPAYNEEKSIERTIKSALSLNYPKQKLEIIVIDDGSRDKTYQLAKKFASNNDPKVRVFTKKNGGKGSALNFGIKNARGEIIITMDADTFVQPETLRQMIGYFYSDKVMCVTPSMGVYNARNVWERIQQIEYYLGVFLRKSFASLNAIHVTPGAFSAYRKVFFEKHGGYDEGNITEDLEIALRIQHHHYIIENASKAAIYTLAPRKFKALLVQRRRWYTGLIRNLIKYKSLFGIKRGPLGTMILPLALFSVTIPVGLTVYSVIKGLIQLQGEFNSLQSINFKFYNLGELNWYAIVSYVYSFFSQPVALLGLVFLLILIASLYFAKRNMRIREGMVLSFIFFMIGYSVLFAFWWIVSFIYLIFNKKVVWRDENAGK